MLRDKVIILIGRKDVGKSINHTCYAKLLSMEQAEKPNDWCGRVTTFNEGVNMPYSVSRELRPSRKVKLNEKYG